MRSGQIGWRGRTWNVVERAGHARRCLGREEQASEQAVMSQDKKLQDMMGSGKGALWELWVH